MVSLSHLSFFAIDPSPRPLIKICLASLDAESESGHRETPSPYEAAEWKDKPIPPLEVLASDSEDEESESDDEDDCYEEEHGDHRDWVVYWSPWKMKNWDRRPHTAWPHGFIRSLDQSKPNDELLKDPDSRRWLHKLSKLDHKDLPSLKVWTKGKPKIPLFKNELTGDEYQLYLHPGLHFGLASIKCPTNLVPSPESPNRWIPRANPLLQVRYRLPPGDTSCDPPISNPEFVIPLGKLAVRTSFREPWKTWCSSKGYPPPTEFTDYVVVIDAGHKDLPVWILVSQSVLRDRMEFDGKNHPQLPVFRGGMENGEYGFDTACIFKSIHDLTRPDFDQACELVRSTRSLTDPRVMEIGAGKMAELSGTELPDDWEGLKPDEVITAEDAEEEANR